MIKIAIEQVKGKDARITALEEVVREFLKLPSMSENRLGDYDCVGCDAFANKEKDFIHKSECLFLKARAVLEGK